MPSQQLRLLLLLWLLVLLMQKLLLLRLLLLLLLLKNLINASLNNGQEDDSGRNLWLQLHNSMMRRLWCLLNLLGYLVMHLQLLRMLLKHVLLLLVCLEGGRRSLHLRLRCMHDVG